MLLRASLLRLAYPSPPNMSFNRPTRYYIPDDDEFVEDSEPERVRQREAAQASRARTVVDLSDDDDWDTPPPADLLPLKSASTTPDLPVSPTTLIRTPSPSTQIPRPIATITHCESESPPVGCLSLARKALKVQDFAFESSLNKSSHARPFSTAARSSPHTVATPKPEQAQPKTTKSKPKHRFTADFTIADLDPMRKTADAKMQHIQTCAKKRAFTDDTIRTLLKKEISSAPEVCDPKRLPTEARGEETTYMEGVVQEAQVKKRKGQAQIRATVKSPGTANANVRKKADDLLAPRVTTSSTKSGTRLSNAKSIRSSSFKSQSPSSTSPLEASDSEDESSNDDNPPATQPFAPSRFGGAKSLFTLGGTHSKTPITSYSKVRNENFLTTTATMNNSTLNENTSTLEVYYEEEDLDSYFDPSYIHSNTHILPSTSSPAPGSFQPVSGKKVSKVAHPNDDDVFEENLKSLIKSNRQLYLKILRYEPIHFNTFLHEFGLGQKPSLKSKLLVRNFLDKQGVHFYGSDARG
ncbi:hypothetical protein DL96DRAFT_1593050 [Flagelloscypha sp. PMI_526]|nr:hypothetical protein DL96DRAFT_1593050 [Flagelloscypha sp. PMI_526]